MANGARYQGDTSDLAKLLFFTEKVSPKTFLYIEKYIKQNANQDINMLDVDAYSYHIAEEKKGVLTIYNVFDRFDDADKYYLKLIAYLDTNKNIRKSEIAGIVSFLNERGP